MAHTHQFDGRGGKGGLSSLRYRLLALIALTTLPSLGLAWYSNVQLRASATADAQARATELTRLASSEHQRLIDEARQILITLTYIPAVRDRDVTLCNEQLAEILSWHPQYTNLLVVLPNGDALCSGTPLSGPVSLVDRKWYQRAMQTHEFATGDWVIGRISGKAALLTGMPILNEQGEVRLLLHAGIDLAWLNRFAQEAQLAPGSMLGVIDKTGTILVRWPDPQDWVGQNLAGRGYVTQRVLAGEREGVGEGIGAEGIPRLFAFAPLGSLGPVDEVFVSVGIPAVVVYAETDRLVQRNLLGLGVVIALGLVVAWFGTDLVLLRRLRMLVRASRRLAQGDLSARSGLPYGRSELGELAEAFDEMAASLQRRSLEREQAEEERAHLLTEIERERQTLGLIEERERIAMDLHDGVLQSLYALALGIEGRERELDERGFPRWPEARQEVLRWALDQAKAIAEEIRNYSLLSGPQPRPRRTLAEELSALVGRFRLDRLVKVEVEVDSTAEGSGRWAAVPDVLYVAREALSNVIRHSRATWVAVRFAREGDSLALTVSDNGSGFDAKLALDSHSGGLWNMAERAHRLAGELLVGSRPGGGTAIRLEFPVAQKSPREAPMTRKAENDKRETERPRRSSEWR
ncbi:MAG: HAMP domain-containing protein [Chloroflexi bacterium]|nr:HAMP domain-containing protein [Chloroflexota bacterium]